MSRRPDLEFVCECANSMEASAVRSVLEAHEIPLLVQGEHTSSVFGALHGATMRPRVLVPPDHYALALRLAETIVGPLSVPGSAEDSDTLEDPYRSDDDDLDDDEFSNADVDEDDEHETQATAPNRPRKLGIAFMLAFLGLGIGFIHMYAGASRRAGFLLTMAICGVFLLVAGRPVGVLLVGCVYIYDVVFGTLKLISVRREAGANSISA